MKMVFSHFYILECNALIGQSLRKEFFGSMNSRLLGERPGNEPNYVNDERRLLNELVDFLSESFCWLMSLLSGVCFL